MITQNKAKSIGSNVGVKWKEISSDLIQICRDDFSSWNFQVFDAIASNYLLTAHNKFSVFRSLMVFNNQFWASKLKML